MMAAAEPSGGSAAGSSRETAATLNALPPEERAGALRHCCAAERWVEGMSSRSPFADDAAVLAAAEELWWSLDPADWLEAFAAHPRIGESAVADRWSRAEQAGVASASEGVLEELRVENARYERRFGHIFLVCASGAGAEELLAALRGRLEHDPEEELRIAASEQAAITRLRLARLAGEGR